MDLHILTPLFTATIQAGTPILFATLGEIFTEKSGILNLGVEGMMLIGALAAFWTTHLTHNPWLGFFCGGLAACVFSALHGLVCLVFLGNQVVSGLALTILGTGLANFLGTPLIGEKIMGFASYPLPLLSKIPLLGQIIFAQDLLVYFSLFLTCSLAVFFKNTNLGLRIRACGENPQAALASGINVKFYQLVGIMAGGFMVGLGGAYLSLAYTHIWSNGLSAGRGWIAVALVIFAFWRPERAILGAYLFGGIMAFQLRFQALGTNIPSSLLLMLPYFLTIIVLTYSSMRTKTGDAPLGLGINIEPEE